MSILKNSKVNTLLVSLMMMTIFLCCSSQVQASQYGDYTYTLANGKAQITDYTGAGGNVTVPSTLGGYPVTGISDYAFNDCEGLTSISLPQGVTSIGDNAFEDCYGLTSISLPQGVTSIGDWAFAFCYGLTGINLPQGITSISDYAFCGCSFKSISLPQGVTSIGNKAFSDCSLTNISLPQELTSIGNGAFEGCEYLTSISLPQELSSIGDGAFERCESLTNITIPYKVTSISKNTFQDCENLTNISLPQELTSIGYMAFWDCASLSSVSIPQGVTSIGSSAFAFCNGLTSITFNSATTTIFDTDSTIPAEAKIIGYDQSTAHDYAVKYNREFEVISPVNISISASDASASEQGPDTGKFTVSRTDSTTSALTVKYFIRGTAINGTDYKTLSGSVVIPIGSKSATITVTPKDDTTKESYETVIAILTTNSAYNIGTANSATVMIEDNDKYLVTIKASDATATEAGPTTGKFTVTRTYGGTAAALTVKYALSGTATNGTDYKTLSGSVVIPIGSKSATITVTPKNDSIKESSETLIATLSANSAYNIGTANSAKVTIIDND